MTTWLKNGSPHYPGQLGLSLLAASLLAACGSPPKSPVERSLAVPPPRTSTHYFEIPDQQAGQEIVIYALGLLGTGYRFGGQNPEAGLDCSGMVRYIVQQVSGQTLPHNAAQIAALTRPIKLAELKPGDLVFFNTMNRRHSHMGIYMGDGRFVHAPSTNGSVRVERLDNRYFSPRIDGARRIVADGA